MSVAALDHRQLHPSRSWGILTACPPPSAALYLSLMIHSLALKSLIREYEKHLKRKQALEDILDVLRPRYNYNYQYTALLETVREWAFHAGLSNAGEGAEGSDNAVAEGGWS